MFLVQAKRYGDRVLYRFFREGEWRSYTWQEALLLVREVGTGLLSLGVTRGDRLAIFSANRVEWSLADWANICIGGLSVPIYSSSTAGQVSHILEHSGSVILFVDSADRLSKVKLHDPALRQVRKIVVMETMEHGLSPSLDSARVIAWDELRELGKAAGEKAQENFFRSAASLKAEDDLTIIYTSGTTGEPKGVLTTHGHYLFMVEAVNGALHSTDQDVNLQFLPFAHSFGRLEHFMVVARGYTCGFARSLETVARDLQIIRPTILFSVPRIYENAYDRIRSRTATAGFGQRLFFRIAFSIGRQISRGEQQQKKISWTLRQAQRLAHLLVFSKIQSAFGGRLRLAISGGAPLAREIAEFFHVLGILILEGYGLTETSTVSHVNRLERYKFGTVGLPLDGVECRIGPDGEILLQGPNIFKGYYRDPAATQEALDAQGWFHSGDIGEIDAEGFLRITDRKKDLIVTSGGKKVAPQLIENLLKTDPLIKQVLVLGDRQRHLFALIVLEQGKIREWAERRGLQFRNAEEMLAHPQVLALVKERIRQKNKDLAPFEAVRGFRIVPNEFTVEREELTPSLKIRRQAVVEHYKDIVEEMFHRSRAE
ncbi:MAG: long-chain fatty acid--CoA ligase [Deltaproteobacteria bacterium]|nr:long-chain fatty acid--CoA ligase [Deltaproteobacteria bacterium]